MGNENVGNSNAEEWHWGLRERRAMSLTRNK